MGRRHVVLLLHGQPGSAADWRQLTALLPPELEPLALDRPGYGASRAEAGGFAASARAALAELDARGIGRAVVAGHSYGGGAALALAALAPERVEALALLASVGPGCLTGWDRLLAAPVAGEACAYVALRLTPGLGGAALAALAALRRRPIADDEHVNWQIWARAQGQRQLWRTFLTEQRALVTEVDRLTAALPTITQPALVLADPADLVVPEGTARALASALPGGELRLVRGAGHHLPTAAAAPVAQALAEFAASLEPGPARGS